MARFFFHQRSNSGLVEDPESSDLRDLDSAVEEALESARHLWAEAIINGQDLSDRSFEICDDNGELIRVVPFFDALPEPLRRK